MIVTANPLYDTDLHHGSQSGESSPIHRGIPHPATHITSSRSCGCTPAQLASLEEAWTSPIRTHTRPIADRDLFFQPTQCTGVRILRPPIDTVHAEESPRRATARRGLATSSRLSICSFSCLLYTSPSPRD